MATNQTEHLKLCQWEADDEVLRADFNADNAKIDEAVAALKASVEEKLEAVRAMAQAAYSPSKKPYVVGTYTGDGTSGRSIDLGFMPSAVLVTSKDGEVHYWSSGVNEYYGGLTVQGAGGGANGLSIMYNGFFVAYGNTGSNTKGMKFNYIAFR